MYGISRIDDDAHRQHAWRVSLRRKGKHFVKNFPDKKWFSRHEALRAAKKHRDQLAILYPPISRREFCNVKRRNNRFGITGVYCYGKPYKLKDGTIKKIWYWEANWPDENGKSLSQAFSINKYGEKGANQRAIDAAYQINKEDSLGSITPGKHADLVVLSANPLHFSPNELRNIRVK